MSGCFRLHVAGNHSFGLDDGWVGLVQTGLSKFVVYEMTYYREDKGGRRVDGSLSSDFESL
jgi:hypothetical protein